MGIAFSVRGTYRVDQDAMVEPGLYHEPFVHENSRYSSHPLRFPTQHIDTCNHLWCNANTFVVLTRSSIFSCIAANIETEEPEVCNKLLIDLRIPPRDAPRVPATYELPRDCRVQTHKISEYIHDRPTYISSEYQS